ncbi:MAG: haloacid dehalogenase type II [Armatimonadota bacterium]|nr:haloacid dehalogenase type II [Armatimonadota bacterium]
MDLQVVTFDVYSALYDITAGLAAAVGELFRRRGLAQDPVPIARTWRQKHMEYLLVATALAREPASNRRAIELTARWTLRTLDPPLSDAELADLVASWTRLPPWPEALEVLAAVRRRPLRLATLSNGDEAMQRALLAATLPVPFDDVISTEGGQFKPHPSVYARALQRLGVEASAVLHVAGSPTDAMGATAAGIRTVWVNRTGDAVLDPRFAPAVEVADLRGLLPLLDRPA